MGEGRQAKAQELRRRAETHIASAGFLSARDLLEDALALYRQETDRAGESACLRGLGDVCLKLGEVDRAGEFYDQALQAARTAGDLPAAADALYRQADLLRAEGRKGDARKRFHEAAEAFRSLGLKKGEAQCLGLLGEVLRELDAPAEEVLRCYRQAHQLQIEAGDPKAASVTLTFIAYYLKDRDPRSAAQAYIQAATLLEGLGLTHRAEPFLAAARRLDPDGTPASAARPRSPWEDE